MTMTTPRMISAASMIARNINRDLDNDPNFTLTDAQLMNRIDAYCDDPDTNAIDICAIFTLLASDPALAPLILN